MSSYLYLGCIECREKIYIAKDHYEAVEYPQEVMRFLMRHHAHRLAALSESRGTDAFDDFKEPQWDSPTPVPARDGRQLWLEVYGMPPYGNNSPFDPKTR